MIDANLVAFIDGSLDAVKEYIDQKVSELQQMIEQHEARMHGAAKGSAGDTPRPGCIYANPEGGGR